MTIQQDSIPYYDHNASKYSERTRQNLDREALEEFVSRLPKEAKVLDLACGAGIVTMESVMAFPTAL